MQCKGSVLVTLLLLAVLAGKQMAGLSPAAEPVPRWTVLVTAASLLATSDIYLVADQSDVTALDRRDGRTLWRTEGLHAHEAADFLGTIQSGIVGVTTTEQQPQVVVLLGARNEPVQNGANHNVGNALWMAELQGRELRSGRLLWHADSGWNPLDVYGETILLNGTFSPSEFRFLNARTGTPLDPARRQDLSILQASAALHGDRHLHWDTLSDGWPIRLNPNSRKPITLLYIGDPGPFLGRVGNKLVWLSIGDDGSTGHGGLPNYVVCYDFSGKMLWQFPAHTVDTSAVLQGQVNWQRLLREAVMDPLHRAILAQDRGGWVYTLNVSNGKVIRKEPGKGLRVRKLIPYGHGYIDYNGQTGFVRYLDGRTGNTERTVHLRLGRYSRIVYAGSDFIFQDWNGKQPQLLCYTAQSLWRR